jgi:predicted dinucleotide-binding enzyme
MLGSRTRENAAAAEWARTAAAGASHGTFADAAAFGEALFNCTAGMGSIEALDAAGGDNLAGKILLDVANPLDFSGGMPPTLDVCNTDSLGERIQHRFPATRVVKTLNTMSARVMVEPGRVPGAHNVFLSGDDGAAKARVATWLAAWFGWPASSVIDLGDISTSRGTEMLLPIWVRLWAALGTADINFHIAGAPSRPG